MMIPRIRLVEAWWIVFTKSYASIFATLATVISIADVLLSWLTNYSANRYLMVAAAIASGLSAFSRIIVQLNLRAAVDEHKTKQQVKDVEKIRANPPAPDEQAQQPAASQVQRQQDRYHLSRDPHDSGVGDAHQ